MPPDPSRVFDREGLHLHVTDDGEAQEHAQTDSHVTDDAREGHERTRNHTRKEERRSHTFIIPRPW